ncbi:MAG: hypothetical protein Q7J60_19915, partial [Bradyrhizobium sp.]|nr:hypothetical protein [Bradyrhizobium sp.]
MNPLRSATLAAAVYPTAVIAGWAFVSVAGVSSPRIEQATAATHVVVRLAPALTASVELAAAPQVIAAVAPQTKAPQAHALQAVAPQAIAPKAIATDYAVPETPEVSAAAELVAMPLSDREFIPDTASAEAAARSFVLAALTDPIEILPPEILPAPEAGPADATPQTATTIPGRIELVGECMVAEACIDQFLWALYQRTPKEDTIKEREQRKVTVKRKGKQVTVTRTFVKLVENDFTWKDPHAAERAGMSMIDYVIGGMDRSFKLKLFRALYAAEAAGLHPGITSAFRDDYRQGIASGLKAASNRSYHGGSLRGGYGRGLAADIVSVNGANRAQR